MTETIPETEPSREEILAAQEEEINEFQRRVNHLVELAENDPAVQTRMIAEIYVFINDLDQKMRTMALNGGPLKMMKAMMARG